MPETPASVTLVIGALAGGLGGLEGRMIVMLMFVPLPKLTLPPGALKLPPPPPAAPLTGSYEASAVRLTR